MASIEQLLDTFHRMAAEANFTDYFQCFLGENSRFLGTDAEENWTIKEFKEFAGPYFEESREKGKPAWRYTPVEGSRKIDYESNVAYFDEILTSESFLTRTRGNGVAIKNGENWFLLQYHLSFPIPNPLAKNFCSIIHSFENAEEGVATDEEAEKKLLELLMRRAHERKQEAAAS